MADADFEQGLQRYQRKLRYGALDRQWQGPIAIRPMIQLRSPLSPLRTHARHPSRLPRPGPVVAMKIRIMGQPAEVDHAVRVLQENKDLDVTGVNGPYPNRRNSRMVRVYVEAQQPDRYAIFDADTGTQHSGWMSKDDSKTMAYLRTVRGETALLAGPPVPLADPPVQLADPRMDRKP